MRGRSDDELAQFVTARTQDLHHDAYVLTASQRDAERLVALTIAQLSREHADFTQGATIALSRMARTAARSPAPAPGDQTDLPPRFGPLATLRPLQRAVLLLEVGHGYDRHSVARALQLSARDVEQAYAAIPPALTDTDPAALRSLLQDFGDLAETPDPATTLAATRAIPQPPRRPWWTYAAAALVIALTVTTVGVTQTWHHDWLRTAAGLNHTHGTHYPAYTQGYKLVGIQDVAPGPIETVHAGSNDAMALQCATNAVITVSSGIMGDYQGGCSSPTGKPTLTPVIGDAAVSINDFSRKTWPVALYRATPWSEYPVATGGFVVQHDETLSKLRHVSADGYASVKPLVSGAVLTLRGDRDHPNGVFEAQLRVPAGRPASVLVLTGLLSPTSTGRYSLLVDNTRQWSSCGSASIVHYAPGPDAFTCSIFDRHVPQLSFSNWGVASPESRSVAVRVTVRNARGPWTLQLAYDRYRIGPDGQPVSPTQSP